MIKEKVTPSSLTSWDISLLLGICLAPFYGAGAALVVFLISLISAGSMIRHRPINIAPSNWVLTIIFLLYFLYFFLQGAVFKGNLSAAFESMHGNLPIVFVAILCLYMGPEKNRLTAAEVGRWAAVATLVTFFLSVFLYILWAKVTFIGESKILDKMELGGRLELISKNPLIFASMYLPLSFLSLVGFSKKSPLEKTIAVVAVVVGVSVLAFWAQARGALLAALPLSCLAFWYIRPKFRKILIIGICLLSIGLALYFIYDGPAQRINKVIDRLYIGISTALGITQSPETSASHRMMMYKLGLQAIKDAPLFGYGIQNRFDAIIHYFPSDPLFRYSHLHNTFITHTVAGGLIGFFVLLTYIFTPVIIEALVKPKSKDIRYLTWVIVIAVSVMGMTEEMLMRHVRTSFFSVLILVHLVSALNEKNTR